MIDLPYESIRSISFVARPASIPASLRPAYRISVLTLVLRINCRANTGSLLMLQFFNWLLKSAELQRHVSGMPLDAGSLSIDVIHIDPLVNVSLKFAIAENLIEMTKQAKYRLTEKGKAFADEIMQNEQHVLSTEREILEEVGKRISEIKLRSRVV